MKILYKLSAMALLLMFLGACSPTVTTSVLNSASSSPVEGSTTQTESTPAEEIPDDTADTWSWSEMADAEDIGRVEDGVEVPLDFPEADVAAPDFLDEDLQALYRKTSSLYTSLCFAPMDFDRVMPLLPGQEFLETGYIVTYDDYSYCVANGRFRNWDNAEALMLSMITQDCFDSLVGVETGPPYRIISINGRLGLLNSGIGSIYEYASIPDEFVLVEMTDDVIEFLLVGHYLEMEEDIAAWAEKRDAGEYSYTIEYSIRLVNTENGWRFDEFHLPQ